MITARRDSLMRVTTSNKRSTALFLRKLGIHLAQDSAIPLLGIYPKDTMSYFRDNSSTIYIAALFTVARKTVNSLNVHQEMNGKKMYIYTMEYCSDA